MAEDTEIRDELEHEIAELQKRMIRSDDLDQTGARQRLARLEAQVSEWHC
jgi:hypothetical protein